MLPVPLSELLRLIRGLPDASAYDSAAYEQDADIGERTRVTFNRYLDDANGTLSSPESHWSWDGPVVPTNMDIPEWETLTSRQRSEAIGRLIGARCIRVVEYAFQSAEGQIRLVIDVR